MPAGGRKIAIGMVRLALPIVALLALAPSSASAQVGGIRGGITDDPDSVFLGGHVAFQGIGSAHALRIEPALSVGFGEHDVEGFDFVSLRLGANLKYLLPVSSRGDVFLYPLFGLSLYYMNFEDCIGDCDETDGGLHLGGGFELGNFGIDLYLGLSDDDFDEIYFPDLTVALLYTFF